MLIQWLNLIEQLSTMRCLLLFFIIVSFSCNQTDTKHELPVTAKDFVLTEKDLVPEGLAFDNRTGIAYIGSMYKRKIVALDSSGNVSDFITEGKDGIWSVLGIEVDEARGHLWAVSSQFETEVPLKNPDSMQRRSSLYCFDISNAQLVKKVLCADTGIFLNDLTVATNGDVFVTETINNRVYLLRSGRDSLERFLTLDSTGYTNGICLSPDEKFLFVGSWLGLHKVDRNTRSYHWVKAPQGVKSGGIDGLSWYEKSLIAHQTDRVVRLSLDSSLSFITRSDTLSQGKEFDIATTGEVAGHGYYFIVNSQVQSAYDFPNKTIKPMDSLENIIIRRIPLKK